MKDSAHFIDGQAVSFAGEADLDVTSPYSGEVIGRIPVGADSAVDQTVESAARAFRIWKRKSLDERIAHLDALVAKVEEERETLEWMLVREAGKPIRSARIELGNLLSAFRYFGEQAPRGNLLGALDDATGEILALQFRSDEDLHGYTQVLQRLITAHGLPCSLYGDRLGVFVRNDDHWTLEEELAGQQSPTQFGQMLAELAIGYIAAHSPQAKGRIERLWETLQDRLVQELRLRQITTVAAAAAYLPEFIADHKRRFAQPARDTASVWRRPPRDLDRILACRYSRVVARDNTVTVPGRWIQIPPGPGRRSWHSCRVEVRERLDARPPRPDPRVERHHLPGHVSPGGHSADADA